MTTSVIRLVSVEAIDNNPFRDTGTYPFVSRKVAALKRSIHDVGMWEGVIAREAGNRYEIAFGHHRIKAAEEEGLKEVPIIVRDLTDEQMLGFMGRENMEDYNADFLVMLETWEAAWKWLSVDSHEPQVIMVASLLGWTTPRSGRDGDTFNTTADACNSAHKLLREGYIVRTDLTDMTVREAREICTRAVNNMDRIEKAGKALGTPAKHIEASKQHVAKAIKTTANQSRAGTVAKKDLRSQVDLNAYKHAQASKTKDLPLFAVFGRQLTDALAKMLQTDAASEKLDEIIKALPDVTAEDDMATLRSLQFELGELSQRADSYKRKLVPTAKRVVPLKAIEESRG